MPFGAWYASTVEGLVGPSILCSGSCGRQLPEGAPALRFDWRGGTWQYACNDVCALEADLRDVRSGRRVALDVRTLPRRGAA